MCSLRETMLSNRPAHPRFLSLPPMRYQNAYVWLVFVSVLDVYLTLLVFYLLAGHEVNPLAALVIQHMGFQGTVVFKLALIVLVIIICEIVGRSDDRTGRTLAIVAVVIAAVPIVYTFVLLFHGEPPAERAVEDALGSAATLPGSGPWSL